MQRVSWSEQEKTPRGIQEYVLYVAQALAALVMVTFGRVFSGEFWDQKPVRKRLQKLFCRPVFPVKGSVAMHPYESIS